MFAPGDEVICVDASDHKTLPGLLPVAPVLSVGARYTVIRTALDSLVLPTVWLAEARNFCDITDTDEGFWSFRFRKVQRRDLTAWLSTSTDFEEPKRAPAKKRERA